MVKRRLHDISDDEGVEDEAFLPLPPPLSPGQGGQDEGDPFANDDEGGEVSRLAEVPEAKRRVAKRPQPKLDSQRLTSDRGLPALRTLFDDVHFKGKGHEAADLKVLMQKMENWAHRLYPKLQFEDFIDKLEKLGAKKEVQTCLKRIRLDMPLTHEDFIGKDGDEEAAPQVHMFDDPDPFNEVAFANEPQRPIHSTPAPAPPPAPSPAAPSLTEEQRRRMELNRQRALEKRLARNQQQQADTQSQLQLATGQNIDPSADKPISVSSENAANESNSQEPQVVENVQSVTRPLSHSLHKDSDPSTEPSQHEKVEEATEQQESVAKPLSPSPHKDFEPSAGPNKPEENMEETKEQPESITESLSQSLHKDSELAVESDPQQEETGLIITSDHPASSRCDGGEL